MPTTTERIQRLEDIRSIRNLMHTYSYLNEYDRSRVFDEMWAQSVTDISLEYENYGVFDGPASIKRFLAANPAPSTRQKGQVDQHLLYNDFVEVAEDGKTAKGAWLSIGYTTPVIGGAGALQAEWYHCRYGVDFIKEDDRWKFYRLHIYTGFNTPYEKSWVDLSRDRGDRNAGGLPPGTPNPYQPDKSNTEDAPFALNSVAPRVPRLPEPYRTFSETFSYVPSARKAE
jgi:hypothetical protein